MAKKRRHYMQRKKVPGQERPPVDPRALEKTLSDLRRLLQGKEFESTDEINAYLQGLMESGPIPSVPATTPIEKAQDIMYEAWDAVGTRRVRLARKALLVSEDCADAYVLLAEEIANTLGEARTFYEQGVAAGERAIGSQVFEEDVGHFWGITETRPYMRARAGLAMVLWRMGELQQAIEHYENLLRLNPNDNQGIRYLLAPLYLEVGADDKLEVLLDEHKDEISADLLYTRALWTFRREGPSKRATAALRTAIRQNPFVPAYLLGEKQLPQKLPDHVGRGDEDEAISYASMSRRLWSDNQEAMDWLKNAV